MSTGLAKHAFEGEIVHDGGPYHGEFGCWADVSRQFSDLRWDRTKTWAEHEAAEEREISEPERVIWAQYEAEGYEGSALVVYADKGAFHVVTGSHCSCYGLEGQWAPTDYRNVKELRACLEKETWGLMKDNFPAIMRRAESVRLS